MSSTLVNVISQDDVDVLKTLVNKENMESLIIIPSWRPAQFAVVCNSVKILSYLLHSGARCEYEDLDTNLLYLAANRGCYECLRFLLQSGACLSLHGNYGRTILHTAVYNQHHNCVKLILDTYPELVFVKCERGNTALCEGDFGGTMAKILLQAGSTVDEKCNMNWTSLDGTSFYGAAIALLDYGASLESTCVLSQKLSSNDFLGLATIKAPPICLVRKW